MKQETIHTILQLLEAIKERPLMYTGTDDPAAMMHFLDGFNVAWGLIGLRKGSDEIYEQITVERGWRWTPMRPWHEMRERGLSNDKIINEMLNIESEVWKRTYNLKG